jgi:hypothetical protein
MKSSFISLLVSIILLNLFISGCQKKFSDIDKLEKYTAGSESPYKQTIRKNGVIISLRYIPTESIMIPFYRKYQDEIQAINRDITIEERNKQIQIFKKKLQSEKIQLDKSIFFCLTLGFEDGKRDIEYDSMAGGFEQYSSWTQLLQFGLNKYITLYSEKTGEIPLSFYRMERTFGITKSRDFLLTFPVQFNKIDIRKISSGLKLIIKEFGLRTGDITIDNTIKGPEIKFSNKDLNM